MKLVLIMPIRSYDPYNFHKNSYALRFAFSDCGWQRLPYIRNGNVTAKTTRYGSIAYIMCGGKFSLEGRNLVKCEASGNWTTATPPSGEVRFSLQESRDGLPLGRSSSTLLDRVLYGPKARPVGQHRRTILSGRRSNRVD